MDIFEIFFLVNLFRFLVLLLYTFTSHNIQVIYCGVARTLSLALSPS